MIIIECDQGTDEWHQARAGRISASCMERIISPTGMQSKQADKYMQVLAAETLTGRSSEGFTSSAMQRGKDMEAEAADYYAMLKGVELKKIGYCHTDDGLIGCSPDRLIVDSEGLLEIKVPNPDTVVEYVMNDKLVQEYTPQLQAQLYVTGCKWVDIMPYLPGSRKQLIKRVHRDGDFIAQMVMFSKEANKTLKAKLEVLKEQGFYP